ncbi:MAG: ATP-binding protein [bacterium]
MKKAQTNDSQVYDAGHWRPWYKTTSAGIVAVVMLVAAPLVFLLVLPILIQSDEEMLRDYQWQFDNMTQFVEAQLEENPRMEGFQLTQMLGKDKNQYGFKHLMVRKNEQEYFIGGTQQLGISLRNTVKNPWTEVELVAVYRPLDEFRKLQYVKYVSAITLVLMVFAVLLLWLMRRIISEPLDEIKQGLMASAAADRKAHLDARRDNEFGDIGELFNHTMKNWDLQVDELQSEIRELTQSVNDRDQVLAANKAKSAFLANMSHEIRTPLTAMLGYAESLYRFRNHSVEERMHALKTIVKNGNHLLAIINDNLDVSKIEADKLDVDIEELSPFQVLEDVTGLMEVKARKKQLRFIVQHHFPLPGTINSSALRLRQILMNLVSNAINYTDKGQITVSLGYEKLSNKIKFTIRDTGVGLSREQISRLFKPFAQEGEKDEDRAPGTGLGLVISQRLARLLGGDIKVNGIVGVGSCFELSVDAGDVDESELLNSLTEVSTGEEAMANAVKHFRSGRVLLVEDVEDSQQLVAMYLRQAGLDVELANNGQEAVDAASAKPFDLVLMDIQMPVMDGQTATRMLRNMDYSQPVVALTANALEDVKKEYLETGFDEVLLKPLELKHFYDVLSHYFESTEHNSDDLDIDSRFESNANSELSQLTEQFMNTLPDYLYRLDVSIEQNDWKEVEAVAHNLKGLGGSFGQPEISELSAAIMTAAKSKSSEAVNESYQKLSRYCETYLNYA